MSLKSARTLTGVYFGLMLIAVTWPGIVPFSRLEPLVFGLPFAMAWIAAWIAGSVVVLFLLDRVEKRYRDEAARAGTDPPSLRDEANRSRAEES